METQKSLIVHVYKCYYVFSPGWDNNQEFCAEGRLECSQCFLLIVSVNSSGASSGSTFL